MIMQLAAPVQEGQPQMMGTTAEKQPGLHAARGVGDVRCPESATQQVALVPAARPSLGSAWTSGHQASQAGSAAPRLPMALPVTVPPHRPWAATPLT